MSGQILRFGLIVRRNMGRLHTQNAEHAPGMDVMAFADVEEERT